MTTEDKKTAEEQENLLPDSQQALVVLDNIGRECFFGKLSEFGIVPQSEQEASQLLEIGYQLDVADASPQLKQAADQESPITVANTLLKEKLAELGVQTGLDQVSQQTEADGIKQAALALATRPDVYASLLAVRAAEAAEPANS